MNQLCSEQVTGYEIKEAKVPIIITMRPLDSLKPHEEVVPEELSLLTDSIKRDKVLRHPILADLQTGVVLDGMHRLLALRKIGSRLAPVALVDYQDDRIGVERWYRIFSRSGSDIGLDDLLDRIRRTGLKAEYADASEAEGMLESRQVSGTIENPSRTVVFHSDHSASDSLELVRTLSQVEKVLLDSGFSLSYSDTRPGRIPDQTLVVLGPRLLKQEVVKVALSGRPLYPPKSTRHLIPSRPLGTRVPVDWLQLPSVEEGQSKLMEHLAKMKLTRLEEGSTIGSRRYQEEVFLFE